MENQAEKAINEVLPRPRLTSQASFEKPTVYVRENHP